MSLSHGISLRLECQSILPLSVFSLMEIPDSSLEEMLKETLADLIAYKKQNPDYNGKNLFHSPNFINKCKEYSKRESSSPLYQAHFDGNGYN